MFFVRMRECGLKHRRCRRERIHRRGRWTRSCEQDECGLEWLGLTDAPSPGIQRSGMEEARRVPSQDNNARVNGVNRRNNMEWNKEHRGKFLLGSDQHSREHALKALNSLVIMPARMATLVLETARNGLRTLLPLLTHTLLCSDMITDQRCRNKKVDKKTDFDGMGGRGFEVLVLVLPKPSPCELLLRTVT